jgi:hypothetical protein
LVFLCDLLAYVAQWFCGTEDTAEDLILRYAHAGRWLGGVSGEDVPQLSRGSEFIGPRNWGKTTGTVSYPIDWARSCVSYVRGPLVPSPYSVDGQVLEILHEADFLPVEPVFTMRLVRVHRLGIADMLRRARLLPPPVMLPLKRPSAEVSSPVLSEPVKPVADKVRVARKPKQPPRRARAWRTLLALMQEFPEPPGLKQSYARYLADKQPADGNRIHAKTFANLMPDAKREIAREHARKPFPRETFPKNVSRGISRGTSGKT